MPSPKNVVIVGAGIVGLSVGWFLQNYDIEVTILEQKSIGSGSSWANAGWLSPSLTTPLPEPAVLQYGIKSLFNPNAPLSIAFPPSIKLINFLLTFSRNCNNKKWQKAMQSYIGINNLAFDAYDEINLAEHNLEFHQSPIMAAFETRSQAKGLLDEFEMIRGAGQSLVSYELSGKDIRSKVPQLSDAIDFGISIEQQRYVNSSSITRSISESVIKRGAKIIEEYKVEKIKSSNSKVYLYSKNNSDITCNAVVVANGAWIDEFSNQLGIKVPTAPGRGYSFSVPTQQEVPFPIYFPATRVACTPMTNNILRVAGTMEFSHLEDGLNLRRIDAIVSSSKKLFKGVDLDNKSNLWVGPRPVSADGMPFVGSTKLSGVYVAAGHGMWGMTLGPITGKLLASQIAQNQISPYLVGFDPRRKK